MSKIIYITETQLNEIVGNSTYLNNQDSTNEYRLGGAEISVDGVIGDYVDGNIKTGKPVTTDKFAKQLKNQNRFGGYAPYIRRTISESNQDFTGKENTFQISQTTINGIKERLRNYNGDKNAPGYKRANDIINKGRLSYDNGYRILDDYSKGNGNELLGDELEKEIRRRLNTAQNISQSGREAKMKKGENIINRNNKTYNIGTAHTPKNKNVIGISYE